MDHRPVRLAHCIALLSLWLSLGCRSDTTAGLVPIAPGQLYARLVLNAHAITMALTPPYDTLQLVATPQSALGTPLADTGKTSYTVLQGDTNVIVDATGLLRSVGQDAYVEVLASRTIGNVTQTDSAFININAVPLPVPIFTTIALQIQPGDSARRSITDVGADCENGLCGFSASALDGHGDSIPNVLFNYSSSNNFIVPIYQPGGSSILLFPNLAGSAGQSVLTADATVYGRHIMDSVIYTVGWPLVAEVDVGFTQLSNHTIESGFFNRGDDTIAAGGVVVWSNHNDVNTDVVFDDSMAVVSVDSATLTYLGANQTDVLIHNVNGQGGNIPAFSDDSAIVHINSQGIPLYRLYGKARCFPVAGTYRYHSTIFGSTGVIHVLPAFQVPHSSN